MKNKFKKGDYIYVLRNGANNTTHPRQKGRCATVDDIILISDVDDEFAFSVDGHVLRIREWNNHFRHATPKEILNIGKSPKPNTKSKTLKRSDLIEMLTDALKFKLQPGEDVTIQAENLLKAYL